MKRFLSVLLAVLLLTGGIAWAGHKKGDSTGPDSPSSSSSKHSKSHKSPKKKGKKAKKAKKGKGSKSKSEVKMESGIGKDDVTIDLKGK